MAIGQATIPLISEYAEERDTARIRRGIRAGTWLALAVVGSIGTVVIVCSAWVVPLFTSDPEVRPQITELLPWVLAVVVTDAAQAVVGFGLIGLKRTVPSFVTTAVCYGVLAAVAAPLATAGGLTALWAALALANSLQTAGKAYAFHRHSGYGGTERNASGPRSEKAITP
ncbi:MATE family efflux transporter [Streptomyces nigra]